MPSVRQPCSSLAAVATVLFAGCAGGPGERLEPVARLELAVTPGAALSGSVLAGIFLPASAGESAGTSEDAALLRVRCFAVPEPAPALDPLGAHALTVVRRSEPQPLGGHPRILPGLQVASRAQAETLAGPPTGWREIAAAEFALLPRAATTVLVTAPLHGRLSLRIVPDERSRAIAVLEARDPEGATEQVLLDLLLEPDAPPLLLHLPPTGNALGLAITVALAPGPAPEELVEEAQRSFERAAEVAAAPVETAEQLARDTLATQFYQLRESVGGRERRPALLGLAMAVEAERCADLATIADDIALADTAAALPATFPTEPPERRRFLLEIAAFRAVLPRLQIDALPPRLYAWTIRHGGTAASNPGVLSYLLDEATSVDGLQAAFVEANVDALTNVDPGTRMRAVRWLGEHGVEVPGFDPLADRSARRRALRAFERARAEEAGK